MEQKKVVLNSPSGLHARPAGDLVKLVRSLSPSKITLSNGAKTVNAASMLSVLSLGLKNGTEVTVTAEGGDERAAAEAVASFIDSVKE